MSVSPVVLFIIGKGRSGTTLLDRAAGALPGFASLGEVWQWDRSLPPEEQLCGCGVRVGDCRVWREVARRLALRGWGDGRRVFPASILATSRKLSSWWYVPVLLRSNGGTARRLDGLTEWVAFCTDFYRTAADVLRSRVLVDSSKWPLLPGPLGLVPGVEARVVHVVRDPRAVAHSWRRTRTWTPGGEPMHRFPAWYSALSWSGRNLISDLVRRRCGRRGLRVRYEDFVERPTESLARLQRLTGYGSTSDIPVSASGVMRLGDAHTLWGNAVRFESGAVEITADEAWRRDMNVWDRRVVTLLTRPWLGRFGYRLRPDTGESDA